MRETGVGRAVMLCSFVVTPNYRPTGLAKLLGIRMKGMVQDKTAREAVVKRSDLNWTLVYSTRLIDGSKAGYGIVASSERVTPRRRELAQPPRASGPSKARSPVPGPIWLAQRLMFPVPVAGRPWPPKPTNS